MSRLRVIVCTVAVVLCGMGLHAPARLSAAVGGTLSVAPDAQPAPPVQTILLTDRVRTWLDTPQPPYQVVVAVKMKLERVGYRVTYDPEDAHEAVLRIRYEEQPGRTYRFLEQGTRITCDLELYRAGARVAHPLLTISLESETGWPQPMLSLYWDAVRRLEENPYYYYLGELLTGWLRHEQGVSEVFAGVLREPPVSIPNGGDTPGPTARQAANALARRAAIEELGRLQDARALDTLWHLAEHSSRHERRVALAAIGDLGDPSAVERLTRLHASEPDPMLRATIEASIAQLQRRS